MSFQWTLVACFLYAEIAFLVFLILPWISVQRWRKILRSRFLQGLEAQSALYFRVVLSILFLLLLDAVREMYSYSHVKLEQTSIQRDLDQDMQLSMKTFRAQRNFYISGFSLLLWAIIRRLVTMIQAFALTEINLEASQKQADSATKEANRLRDLVDEGDENNENRSSEDQKVIAQLREELGEMELKSQRKDKEFRALKSQADGVSKEYDRLLEEYANLEKKLKDGSGDKKDD